MANEDRSAEPRRPNRLIHEKSPYLLQHALNPVDWHPWGEEAFEKARAEDKPVFLSVGYSTCHWCHVMERESFEDPEVARLLNEVFVPVKVDREERPDVDSVYMTVCQALTGGGGWPLTVILTPEKEPFFAGTYFPKETRYGRIGLMELVPRIQALWRTRRDEAVRSASQVASVVRQLSAEQPGGSLDVSCLRKAASELGRRFDSEHGGFGTAPKFPTPHNFLFLLRYWKRTAEQSALDMVETSLEAMRLGGIYDHLGFGFHRYATDARWLVPHFEKMLYDQAMLTLAYTEAYLATGKSFYGQTAREICTYVLRDLSSPEGGFFSAEDADSEGEEGKFYLWTEQEIREALGEDAELLLRVFNVKSEGNFAEESSGRKNGLNILHLVRATDGLAAEFCLPEDMLRREVETARQKLFERRNTRVHPFKDDKVLADWNGLMIAALARAGQALDEPGYVEAARRAADFILNRMRSPDGGLLHRYRDGEADLEGYLDDYAFMIWGLLDLYEASFDVRYLEAAFFLNRLMLEHFWDPASGGFYFTSDRAEKLLARRKELYDGALPSGNSAALLNLVRLSRIAADPVLERHAEKLVKAFAGTVDQAPSAFTQFLVGLDFAIGPSCEIVLAGKPGSEDLQRLARVLRTSYIPNKVVIVRPTDAPDPDIMALAPYTEGLTEMEGGAAAYVCRNHCCERPTSDPEEMLHLAAG